MCVYICECVLLKLLGQMLWVSLVSFKGCYSVVHCYYSIDSILVGYSVVHCYYSRDSILVGLTVDHRIAARLTICMFWLYEKWNLKSVQTGVSDVLRSPSLTIHTVPVDVKQHSNKRVVFHWRFRGTMRRSSNTKETNVAHCHIALVLQGTFSPTAAGSKLNMSWDPSSMNLRGRQNPRLWSNLSTQIPCSFGQWMKTTHKPGQRTPVRTYSSRWLVGWSLLNLLMSCTEHRLPRVLLWWRRLDIRMVSAHAGELSSLWMWMFFCIVFLFAEQTDIDFCITSVLHTAAEGSVLVLFFSVQMPGCFELCQVQYVHCTK